MPFRWLSLVCLLCCFARYAMAQQLPVVRLYGSFGYDYADATVVVGADTLTAQAKWRGGTTNAYDRHKRNYKIKLPDNHQLLGMRTDNHWLLDAGQADPFRLRNRVATDLWLDFATQPYYHAEQPEARSAARGRVVEVYLNDDYVGVYSLTENVDRKQMHLRKATSQAIRGVLWKAKGFGASMMYDVPDVYDNYLPQWDTFEAKYPEPGDDLDSTDYQSLHRAVSFVANASDEQFRQQAAQYFDLPVVLDYYLFINVLGAVDNVGKNTFWAVYDQTQSPRLTLAVWDLDATVGQPWLQQYNPEFISPSYDIGPGINLIKRLLKLNVDDFKNKAAQRYAELRRGIFRTDSLQARYRDAYALLHASGADQRETERWSGDTDIMGQPLDFALETNYICQWLSEHLKHLDQTILPTNISGITEAPRHQQGSEEQVFTLSGSRVRAALRPGVHITQGKKLLKK